MKILYEWLKRGRHAFLRRVELFTQEDLDKKPEIPQGSPLARIHQNFLDNRARRKKKRHG